MYINKIGDEVHFILECKALCNLISFSLKVTVFPPNAKCFCEIMTSNNYATLKKQLCMFIKNIDQIVCSPHLRSV